MRNGYKTTMKSRILNDLAGVAGAAYSVANGVREEVKTIAKNQVSELSARLDLVPRSELDSVEILALRTKEESENLKAQLTATQNLVRELQERIRILEAIITE
ncbi:accessory factor UbiK family protein [Acetobacteraceae bacterium]|nr:accessory factor UbiK family protein [Acetobacteraceae bacterium]